MNRHLKRILKFFIPAKLRILLKKKHLQFQDKNKKRKTLRILPKLAFLESKNNPMFIVSLTSYGERLSDTAPYTIITLLNQSVKPDKIILWVAHEDKEKIPPIMEKLVEKGLDIYFCEDIKSYKKLIPALSEFPDDFIITVDDDVFYSYNWFESLIVLHKKNPGKIICCRAHGINVDENNDALPYYKWDKCIASEQCIDQNEVFPVGVGGILYPPKCLYKDILKKELFTKLAPYADDIWFWAMAVINEEYFGGESPYVVVPSDNLEKLQLIKKKERLSAYNLNEGGNDRQLKAVIENYPQIKKTLEKINPNKNSL